MAHWAEDWYAIIDSLDADAGADAVSSDVRAQFGNLPPTHGREAYRESLKAFYTGLSACKHNMIDIYDPKPGVTICEMQIDNHHRDGTRGNVNSTSVIRHRGSDHEVYDLRVYLDLSPYMAGSAGDTAVRE